MNYSIPLLALLAANRLGDSSSDAGRVAMLAMMIRPPWGLLIALMVARQKADTAKKVIASASGKGSTIVNSVIPKADHSFFPTFIGLSRREAIQRARELRLTPILDESKGKDRVESQDPKPGDNWPHGVVEVTLHLK